MPTKWEDFNEVDRITNLRVSVCFLPEPNGLKSNALGMEVMFELNDTDFPLYGYSHCRAFNILTAETDTEPPI